MRRTPLVHTFRRLGPWATLRNRHRGAQGAIQQSFYQAVQLFALGREHPRPYREYHRGRLQDVTVAYPALQLDLAIQSSQQGTDQVSDLHGRLGVRMQGELKIEPGTR